VEETISGAPAEAQPDSGGTKVLRSILRVKGLSPEQIDRLIESGVAGRDDFAQIGDAGTLVEMTGASRDVAERVMAWAAGGESKGGKPVTEVVVQSADVVLCVHCNTRQPKDYKSGDLCVACGKQAEPILACFWCGAIGPGKYCRRCGAEFVPTAELELGILLKREGVPKDDIPQKLRGMTQAEKDVLWGRARHY